MTRILNWGNKQMNQFALDRSEVSPGDYLLDVGCGGGDLVASALRKHGCHFVMGVDPSSVAIEHCRQRMRKAVNANQARFEVASVEALPIADSSVDQLISSSTIYFFDDIDHAISECRRVLRPAGKMVICFNDVQWLRRRRFDQCGFRLYDVDQVEHLLSSRGFDQVNTEQRRDRLQGIVYCTVGRKVH